MLKIANGKKKKKFHEEFFNESDVDFEKLKIIQSEEKILRTQVKELIDTNTEIESNDKDYVFLHFILNYLPSGIIGLLIAVIISAAMSSTASELNALAATTTIDIYKRNTTKKKYDKITKLSHWIKTTC